MKSFTKNSIVSSLILFALSTVIGIIPLAVTLTHYHLQLSNSNEKQQRAKRLEKYVKVLLIIGYILLIAQFVIAFIYLRHRGAFQIIDILERKGAVPMGSLLFSKLNQSQTDYSLLVSSALGSSATGTSAFGASAAFLVLLLRVVVFFSVAFFSGAIFSLKSTSSI